MSAWLSIDKFKSRVETVHDVKQTQTVLLPAKESSIDVVISSMMVVDVH